MKSMTGFASATQTEWGYSWSWDLRSVNARGMDARLRLPDWVEGLEASLKPMIQKTVARGNVNLTLKLSRDDSGEAGQVDPTALNHVLATLKHIEIAALGDHNLKLAPTSASDILAMRALNERAVKNSDTGALLKALIADFGSLLGAFDGMRKTEGKALFGVLGNQLNQIETLTKAAQKAALARRDTLAETLQANLARVLDNADGVDADRVAQELAILTLKSDITEEIDRLFAHVTAARELLQTKTPVGRKLDFLSQEFNREANTLCSKAQSIELTKIGLDLKAVIEQLREQVQNVE